MKNKQFSIMNNGGGCNRRRLCRMYKQSLAVVSALTILFTTSAVLPCSNFNLAGGITASAEESEKTFVLDVPYYDINFSKEASEGHWKEDATLEKDGYHWDANSQTLTLGNIQINCNDTPHALCLPENGLNKIVIAEGANPIVSNSIHCVDSSLTITGKGTLTTATISIDSESDNMLTITGGAEVISNGIWCKTNGGIAINEGGKLNVSNRIDTPKITMDDTAVLELGVDTAISFYPTPENYLSDIRDYFPSGYKMEKLEFGSSEEYHIIPEYSCYVLNEDGGYDLLYKDGTPVTGKVTIKANQSPESIGEKLVGHSISLAGNIGVNFYMELDESIVNDSGAYMKFTLPNSDTQKVTIGKPNDDGYYVFSCDVTAKEMADTITAQMITSDGEGTVYEYSVKEYADYITSHSNNYYDDTINLVEAMMNYGNSAKSYFSNEETTDISDVTEKNLTEFEKDETGTLPDGMEYYGSSLLLESETTVRHYFKVKNGTDVSKYDFKDKNGYYYTDIPNISAGQLATPQTRTIGDWSISYSPMSYAYDVLNSDTASDNLKNLVKALYLYQQTAEVYQNGGK